MAYVDQVQAWIRSLPVSKPAEIVPPPGVDPGERRAVLWSALEAVPARRLEMEHRIWSRRGFLDAFVSHVGWGMLESLGEGKARPLLAGGIDEAIRARVSRRPADKAFAGPAVALELTRLADEGAEAAEKYVSNAPNSLDEWARGVLLVGDGGKPTELARVLTRLTGRQAVHFVLELETALSTGIGDELRVARRTLASLRQAPLTYHFGEDDPPFAVATLRHLVALDVALDDTDAEGWAEHYTLSPDMLDLADAVLDDATNPIRALVHSLLDAERGRVAAELTGQPHAAGVDFTYVQMIVHEMRNTLLPLQNAISRLWPELERAERPDPARVSELRERIDRSLTRLADFTRDSARLASAVAPEPFSLREVVEEAMTATEADRNGRIRVDVSQLSDASIEGPRGRWNLLFVNLFRNAAQARAGSGIVWVSTEWSAAGTLHVYVDDDGPGVPVELRDRIFEMGISTRGGSGLGLHEARTTAHLSRGTLVCEDSPRGGARFHLQVPARRRS